MSMRRLLLLSVLASCADLPADSSAKTSTQQQDTTVCGVGPTVKGIDVSQYQGTINWTSVKNDGVHYALIRVSDGLNFPDPKFDQNWTGSRSAGVKHGAYQFFEPAQDPIAQADMLLSKIHSQIGADDLPPMLDVEVTGGLGPSAVAAAVKKWVDHVTSKVGRPPIIYTGVYFWRDQVGGANETASPLFLAQYTSAACPDIPAPWTNWAIWQWTSTGSVAGISGNVDMDRWNGDLASFNAFLGPPGTCGDGTCGANESQTSCPEDCGPCATIEATGGMIDNGDACYATGGPQAYLRHVTTAGMGGNLDWTHATSDATEANFADWTFYFAAAGKYTISVYTAAAYAQSKQAKYVVTASGGSTQDVVIDQTANDGWQTLGTFDFDAGGHQGVHLGDNTGEASSGNVQLVFDAVQITPVDGMGSGSGSGDPLPPKSHGGGCSAGGGGGALSVLALAGLLARRRRVTTACGSASRRA
jgi:GH25 family lysozyme M1 (1,4-beta-N-acetylmuramidase)